MDEESQRLKLSIKIKDDFAATSHLVAPAPGSIKPAQGPAAGSPFIFGPTHHFHLMHASHDLAWARWCMTKTMTGMSHGHIAQDLVQLHLPPKCQRFPGRRLDQNHAALSRSSLTAFRQSRPSRRRAAKASITLCLHGTVLTPGLWQDGWQTGG